jgi:hypothetical protein
LLFWGCSFNFVFGILEVWDTSNQLRAAISFNLSLEWLKMVAYEVEDSLFVTWGTIYRLGCFV